MKRQFVQDERGMTLVEILAVVVLIGIIMTVLVQGISGQSDAAKAQLNSVRMEKVTQALSQYKLQFNTYPSSLNDLVKPSSEIRNSGQLFTPLLKEEELKDVFGNDYVYKSENSGRSFALTSLGADGIAGGEGADQDITKRP